MLSLIKKIVGTKNDREVKRIRPCVSEINELEAEFQKLHDSELRDKTEQFKKRVREETDSLRSALEEVQREALTVDTEEREELKSRVEEADKELRKAEARILEELLPEAFAAVREASRRTIGLRHFDVQLIGGVSNGWGQFIISSVCRLLPSFMNLAICLIPPS